MLQPTEKVPPSGAACVVSVGVVYMTSGSFVKKGYIRAQLVFVSKCRFRTLKNPKTLAACKAAFDEVQQNHGIVLSEVNFAENHVHSLADIPLGMSAQKAVQLLKGVSARRIFQAVPNLRKRYPRGSFWSSYYHCTSTGQQNEGAVVAYIRGQQEHHGIVDQKKLTAYFS